MEAKAVLQKESLMCDFFVSCNTMLLIEFFQTQGKQRHCEPSMVIKFLQKNASKC